MLRGDLNKTASGDRLIGAADAFARDLRRGVRTLLRDWRFAAPALVILAVGIGATTAIFSVVNAALFRRHAFADSDRLVDIYQNAANPGGVDGNSYPAYLDVAAYNDVFASTTAVLVPHGVNYQQDGVLRPAVVEHTTSGYLTVLGLRPSLGRWFDAAEDARGAGVVAVLSHQSWTRKFHADSSVIGRTIRIEGVPVTIVGVGPAGLTGTIDIGLIADFWLPISSLPAFGAPPGALSRRPEEAAFLIKARLREGISVAQAQAAMRILGTRLAAEYPSEDPGKGIAVYSARDVRVHPQIDAVLRGVASALLGVVGLVLAIACSNLSTLLLVRGTARAKDVAVRLALGATRAQLVRHLLIESLLLAGGGGLAGCFLAWWTTRALSTLDLPIVVDVSVDDRVLVFAVGISLITGLMVGLAPALKATRIDLIPTLRDDGEPRSASGRWITLKHALVVFQVVVSVVLLAATSLALQMLGATRAQRIGFAIDGIAMLETDTRYVSSARSAAAVMEDIRRRVAAIPGMQSAVLTLGLPMQVTGNRVVVEGTNADSPATAGAIWTGAGYFETLRIPILFGRAIDERDRRETPRVAVISETMARQYFGTVNALGRRFRFEQDVNGWLEVVGVVADTGTASRQSDLVDPMRPLFYRSFVQWDAPPNTVLARTSLDAADLAGAMQRELRAVDAELPVLSAKTMAQYLDESLLAPKAAATFFGGLGALALSLAGVGLYAVVAFAVSRRSREIGIRMALGARSRQVVSSVVREVAVLVGVGTGVGLLCALATILILRAVAAPAPGISLYRPTADPVALIAIAGVMTAVGLAASALPAWRAASIDPLAALRRD